MAICFFLSLFFILFFFFAFALHSFFFELELYNKNMLICHYYGENQNQIDFASNQCDIMIFTQFNA